MSDFLAAGIKLFLDIEFLLVKQGDESLEIDHHDPLLIFQDLEDLRPPDLLTLDNSIIDNINLPERGPTWHNDSIIGAHDEGIVAGVAEPNVSEFGLQDRLVHSDHCSVAGLHRFTL